MKKVSKYLLIIGVYVLLPFVILGGIEFGLRVCGYGVDLDHLFLQTPQGDYLYLNKDISRRYFTHSQATNGNVEFFRKKKRANTFRVFVLGESAAMGFPYPNNISFQRMLKYHLRKANPDKDVEIINLSLTAINSYTFYDFAKEIIHQEPDAVFIYGGHNEYYGALGVASNNRLGSFPDLIRLFLRLRQLRISQWLDALKTDLSPRVDQSDNLMKYVVREQVIPYQGELFERGLEQFRLNMELTLGLFKRHQIPVFLSTVGVNLSDLKPFKSIPAEDGAVPGSADDYYELGQRQLRERDSVAAYASFSRARDLDALRFRAPKEINEIIRELAATDDNVYLVDSEKEFNRQSPYGIPGRKLLLEHVHPTIEGHRVIAGCFLESLRQGTFARMKNLRLADTFDLYDFPVLEFDSLAGEYACLQLRKGFPFYEKDLPEIVPHTEVEKMAWAFVRQKNWFQSMDQLYTYALNARNDSLCLEILKVRSLDNPYDITFLDQGGEFAEIRKDYPLAVAFYTRSFRLRPTVQMAQNLVSNHLRLDQPDRALPYIDYILRNGGTRFKGLQEMCREIIQYKQRLNQHPSDSIRHSIGRIYRQMGNQEAARRYDL